MGAARMEPPFVTNSRRNSNAGSCDHESHMMLTLTARHARPHRRCLKPLQSFLKLACVAHFIVFEMNALAEQPERTQWPIATEAQGETSTPVQNGAPSPEPSRFALTFNPLNLIIGRYGFNFEYQPVLHHGLILTPHYDYLSGSLPDDGGCLNGNCTDTLNGVGAELGYRFYSGRHGFDGFFAGPSLLIARRKLTGTYEGHTSAEVFTSVGGAFDVGWQWQQDHFSVGIGAGVQYTKSSEKLSLMGAGIDILINWNAGDGWLPRLAFNLGYAF